MPEPSVTDTRRLTVSAVIPTRNRPRDLLRAVASVLAQHRLPDELLVIDQSGTNESERQVLEQYTAAGTNLRLVYIRDPNISGLVEAKARGVQESNGAVISFLEDDVVLKPEYFSRLEQGFLTYPEMLGCSGVVTSVADQGPVYRWLFKLFHRGIFYDPRVNLHGFCKDTDGGRLIPSRYLSGGLSAYRQEVFNQVRFDIVNDFFMLEDIEFSTRAAKVFGDRRFYINTAVRLEHHMSPVNRERLGPRWERKLREYVCFYKKHRKESWACVHLTWLLIGLGLEAMYASLRMLSPGPFTGALRGLIRGLQFKIRPL